MRNLEVRTRNALRNSYSHKDNIRTATVFLANTEDKITVIKGNESTNIEIYDNGKLLFAGDKRELFEKLKQNGSI